MGEGTGNEEGKDTFEFTELSKGCGKNLFRMGNAAHQPQKLFRSAEKKAQLQLQGGG